ncbi:MAG: tetratricopeptide repeat protein [Bacteroidetes bacterium]|nr:tetratricopeptide repeat protein [Bacteroidota bacterium]
MKKYFWLLMLVLCAIGAHAQSPRKLDSLRTVLAQLPPEGSSYASDTMRVRLLCEVAQQTPLIQIDSTIKIFEKSLLICQQIKWPLGECMSNYYIGYYQVGKNDLMKGIDYLYKSLAIAEKEHLTFYIARNNKTLGDAYSNLGSYDKATKHLKASVKIFAALKNKREELLAMNNLGLVYFDKADYKTSIPYFKQCLNENKIAQIDNLDDIFLSNLGASYREMGNLDEALKELIQVEDILKNKPRYQYRRLLNLLSIANVWTSKNAFEKAELLLKQIEEFQLKEGTEISQKDIYKAYLELYKKMKNAPLALEYYEKYIALDKKLTQQDQQHRIENLQAGFDNEKKESEILLLNQNVKQEILLKNIFIGGAIIILLFAVLFWRNSQKLSKQNKIIEEQRLELQFTNSQLETLNHGLEQRVEERTSELQHANETLIKKNEEIVLAMVEGQTIERKRVASELHDNLGATLSAIKWRLEAINGHNLTDKERKIHESTLEMMKEAYSEVRLISHNLLPAELEKGGLKQALEKFIADINSSNKINITHNLESEAIPTDKKIQLELYSIALELINNVLKHSQAQNAHVGLYKQQGNLIFEVSDDGKGLDSQQQSNGMGTKNIENRVQALNGSVEYFPVTTGVKVVLKFSMY